MNHVPSILITGASGFIGKRLANQVTRQERGDVTAAVRHRTAMTGLNQVAVGAIDGATDWTAGLANKQTVVHAAALAHVTEDTVADILAEFRKVNVAGTLNLACQAAAAGIKRFVFISSIKVNGEETRSGQRFTAEDTPMPLDPYGISKLEAERGLFDIARETGMEVVVIRPPLVYGPGVKGNFASLMNLIRKGIPLPLGAIQNNRSFVGLDNLVDLIITCIDHPAAANQVFLASDGQDLSITELLRALAKAMGRTSRLIPVPATVLRFGAKLLGKEAVSQRLLGSLQVDISKTRALLGWEPPVSVEDGLRRCATPPVRR